MDSLKGGTQGKRLKLLAATAAVLIALLLILAWSSSGGAGISSAERQIQRAVEQIAGVGRADAVVTYAGGDGGEVVGVVVVCEGAGDVGVRLRVLRAVAVLAGVDEGSVEIFEMKEAGG